MFSLLLYSNLGGHVTATPPSLCAVHMPCLLCAAVGGSHRLQEEKRWHHRLRWEFHFLLQLSGSIRVQYSHLCLLSHDDAVMPGISIVKEKRVLIWFHSVTPPLLFFPRLRLNQDLHDCTAGNEHCIGLGWLCSNSVSNTPLSPFPFHFSMWESQNVI